MHSKALGVAVLASIAIGSGCVGCTASEPQAATTSSTTSSPAVPTLSGPTAILSVVVDCGQDGAARVRVAYGKFADNALVSRALAGHRPDAVPVFSKNYGGMKPGAEPANFVITTTPTSGVCKTTLTDYAAGSVLEQRETAGFVMLRASLTG